MRMVFGAKQSATLWLVGINIVVFLIQQIAGRAFTEAFYLTTDSFMRPWTLFSAMFLHADLAHLMLNMIALLSFGSLLESKIGTKRFLQVYLTGGLLANIVGAFVYTAALGASAAISAVIGSVIILLPHLQVLFFFVIPMRMWMAGVFLILSDIMFQITPGSSIAGLAHIIGMVCGLIMALYFKANAKNFQKEFAKKNELSETDIEEYIRNGRI